MTDEEMTELAINTIRTLSVDAVQQAKSGQLGGFAKKTSKNVRLRHAPGFNARKAPGRQESA
jgi:hypothetical protein